MSAKKASNSPENFISSPSEDVRGMSLRARRGIRSKRIREMMPYIEEEADLIESSAQSSSLEDSSIDEEKLENNTLNTSETNVKSKKTARKIEKTSQEDTPTAPKKRGRPPRKTKLSQEEQAESIQEKAETVETAPEILPEAKKAPEDQPAPQKKRGRPKKNTSIQKDLAISDTDSSQEKPKKSVKKKEKRKEKLQSEQSEQEEILSTLKESPKDENKNSQAHTLNENFQNEKKQQVENLPAKTFEDLNLSHDILRAIKDCNYTTPTAIQGRAIPLILQGRDVLGVAQTGTGKTASFILPLLEKLSTSRARARMPRSLILEPTRELALQVAENIKQYGKYLNLNHALLIGGNSMNEQKEILQRGVDILIATPGRLIDIFERGDLLLNQTELLVIDEADRMLDMGFIPEIEKIVSLLPNTRQTLFFSATMAPAIKKLADNFLNHAEEISVAQESSVTTNIHEFVFFIKKEDKRRAIKRLLQTELIQNAIIFCNRKRDVDLLFAYLNKYHFSVGHLHGDLDQNIRFETLERFRSQELHVLVCSDVAARGIDISGLSHVFNYDLPFNAEDYVHRIGRTGRAGNSGYAFNFVAPEEIILLEAIEKLTKKPIEQAVIEGFEISLPESHIIQPHMEQAILEQEGKLAFSDSPPSVKEREITNDIPQKALPQKAAFEAPAPTMPEPAQEYDHSLELDKNGFLPAISEKDSVQKGFGGYTPHFMEISFSPQTRSFPVI